MGLMQNIRVLDNIQNMVYIRYLQSGNLSPITRIHCEKSHDYTRYPWAFGHETLEIVRKYVKLRYRLLPTIYTAAHQTYLDGTPLLRRLDEEYPQYAEAKDNSQYLARFFFTHNS